MSIQAKSPSPLQALAQLITTSVTALESVYKAHNSTVPSLDATWQPHPLDKDERVEQASAIILSAAYQLIASVGSPVLQLSNVHGSGMYTAAAFQYVVETSVPDILQEGNSAGMHVKDIASKMKNPPADSNRLARVLRFLASRHIFREVTPNVFVNNRTSSALCKAKSLKEINDDPITQYDGLTPATLVGHFTDEGLSSVSHMSAWLQAPDKSLGLSPFAAAHKVDDMWAWFEQPGNEMRRNRFTGVMKTMNDVAWKEELFTTAVDWASYPDTATVVDVGGSLGTVSLLLARTYPHLNFVIQDLPKVIETETKRFWDKEHPELVQKGKIHFLPHDFFTPNPTKEADVYFLRTITHDWDAPQAASILKHLRDAAKPSTKLILFDYIMPYACLDPNEKSPSDVPWPLLANLGLPVGGSVTGADMHMMNLFGAQERTVDEFTELGKLSGWKVEKIVPGLVGAIVYIPV